MDENPYQSPQTESGEHDRTEPSVTARMVRYIVGLAATLGGLGAAVVAVMIALELKRNIELGRADIGNVLTGSLLMAIMALLAFGLFNLVIRLARGQNIV